ncbi:MAG: c-type cytochrome [Roseiarcus sp.]
MNRLFPVRSHRSREGRAGPRRRFGLALSLAVSMIPGAPVHGQEPPQANPPLSRGWVFGEQGGAALYAGVCAACHQPDAKGAVGAGAYPALAADKNLASADYMAVVLLDGLRGMPPLGKMMSDAQAADVINYVRTHFGNRYGDAISAGDIKARRPAAAPTP